MKHSIFILFVAIACLLTSCTKDVEKGKQEVDDSSLNWLPNVGGTQIFKSVGVATSLQITNNNRKTSYIDASDCDKKFPKETCYHYDMQQVFITANTLDNTFSVTYAIIRSIGDNAFYDRLEVSMFEDEKTFANMAIITWAENADKLNETKGFSDLQETITLDGKTFQNVYHKTDVGGDLYFSKEKGVVAFETGDGKLWVLQ